MKIFLRVLNIFFVTLGVIFFVILIGIMYIWIADPFNIRSFIPNNISPIEVIKSTIKSNDVIIDNIDKNPLLSEEQEAQLEALNINPSDLPSEITPEMEECFIKQLGTQRTNEIIQGAQPGINDFLKSRSCLN
jgi:hypothetical protein